MFRVISAFKEKKESIILLHCTLLYFSFLYFTSHHFNIISILKSVDEKWQANVKTAKKHEQKRNWYWKKSDGWGDKTKKVKTETEIIYSLFQLATLSSVRTFTDFKRFHSKCSNENRNWNRYSSFFAASIALQLLYFSFTLHFLVIHLVPFTNRLPLFLSLLCCCCCRCCILYITLSLF